MNRRLALALIAAFGLGELTSGGLAYAADPTSVGTWDLNIAKSKSTDPMPKSITRTYEVTPKTEKLAGTIVTLDGKSIPITFTATLDGKDSPYQAPGVDTVALTPVDGMTIAYVTKLAGKQIATGTRTLSADGKLMTFVQKGVNAAGAPFESVMVYDRR